MSPAREAAAIEHRPETFVPVFAGRVKRGKLEMGPDYEQWLRSLGDKTVEVIVQEPYQRRSLDANAYYHFIIRLISNRTGYTEREAADWMKALFLPVGVDSTRYLSRRQFRDYLEMVIYFADGWLECKIPPARRVAVAA